MAARTDQSSLSEWRWTVDLYLLIALGIIALFGIVLSFAGSPPVAERIGIGVTPLADRTHSAPDSFHFIKRHIVFFLTSLPILFGSSFLSTRSIRRLMTIIFIIGICLLLYVLLLGYEINGARRWIFIAGFSIQPSELVKPSFIVVAAWLFAEQEKNRDYPFRIISFLLLLFVVILLSLEPDLGQSILLSSSWGIVFYVAGISVIWFIAISLLGICGAYVAYLKFPHFSNRIVWFAKSLSDKSLPNSDGNNISFQVNKARDSFLSGGWFGRGPGEGIVKWSLPDSHSDFIFAVLGEEFGILTCLLLVFAICFVVTRGMYHALKTTDPFEKYAIVGLVSLLCLQSVINMSVNLHLIPTTGMTLPLVSYGGTSLLSTFLSMGCLLAFCRNRPQSNYAT